MRRHQATAALVGASVVAGAVGWSMFSASSLAIPDEGKSDSRDPKGRPAE